MKHDRIACCVAAISAFAACSGRYDVGVTQTTGVGPTSQAQGGSFVAGANERAGAGRSNGSGGTTIGAGSSTGGAGPSTLDDGPSYCGVQLPTAHETLLATPATVFQRIQLFLLDRVSPPPALPGVTTRVWAGDTALGVLDQLNVASAAGLNRFVSGWWLGTPTPELWASYFSSRRGSLGDLLTSQVAQQGGAGVLTDPTVLARGGISARGAFIARQLLCVNVQPSPMPPSPMPVGESERAQLENAVAPAPCRNCHSVIDPLGFALGHFQQDGAYRELDSGLPIDTSSTYTLSHSGEIAFADVDNLTGQLENTCEMATCFAQRLLNDAQQSAALPGDAASAAAIAEIAVKFGDSGLDLRGLVRAVVESDTFLRP